MLAGRAVFGGLSLSIFLYSALQHISGSSREEHLLTKASRGHQNWREALEAGQQLGRGTAQGWVDFSASSLLDKGQKGVAVSLKIPGHPRASTSQGPAAESPIFTVLDRI